ncbi:MAG TPA: transcriptional regulator [Nitrospirales bacterium]|nr:transcriptional regulator [Nitrospirales bacterium]
MPQESVPSVSSKRGEVPADFQELVQAVDSLPAAYQQLIEPILERVVESTYRRRRILTLIQQSMNQLKVDVKYLVFDLEATRRERDKYRIRSK